MQFTQIDIVQFVISINEGMVNYLIKNKSHSCMCCSIYEQQCQISFFPFSSKVITKMVCAEIFDELLKKASEDKHDGCFLKVLLLYDFGWKVL